MRAVERRAAVVLRWGTTYKGLWMEVEVVRVCRFGEERSDELVRNA